MSLVFFVGKKNRKKRMVMDYYNLNSQTVKNNYPLPLITELINNIGGKKVFTKMDLRQRFNNVKIKERDKQKRAFMIYVGSFELTVMFFGMTNSPATFQAVMNEILRDLINERKVAVFIDDVLVGTKTEKGHDEIVKEILRRLEENNLYVKLEKCVQKVRKIGFLGVVIGPNGIEIEKKKVDRVLSWPEPKNIEDIRKFLGLANYYRRFIKDFAQVTRLMNMLTRKNVKWQWGQEQQQTLNELKGIFTMKPVLASSDLDKEFRVEADASNYTTEEVLSMKYSDELQRLVAFILKLLSNTKKIMKYMIKKCQQQLDAWKRGGTS